MKHVAVATVGELVMWNLTVAGVVLENEPPDAVVTVPANVAAQLAVRILDRWGLSPSDALAVAPATVRRYRQRGVPHRQDTLARIEGVLRLHAHLKVLMVGDAEHVRDWLRRPMRAFDGRAPVAVLNEQGPAPLVRFTAQALHW